MAVFVSRRALTAKARGSKGGTATAKSQSPEFLVNRATRAGCQTRDRYGVAYYRFIRSKASPRKSSKQVIKETIEKIIPTIQVVPTTSVGLMQAAAKAIVK